jgi:hypothetical protein
VISKYRLLSITVTLGLAQVLAGCLQSAFRRPEVASFTASGHAPRLISVRRLYISGPEEDPSAGQMWRQIAANQNGCLSVSSDANDADALLEVSADHSKVESRTVSGTLWSQDGEKLWWGSAKQYAREAANVSTLGVQPFLQELGKAVGCASGPVLSRAPNTRSSDVRSSDTRSSDINDGGNTQ